MGGCGGRCALTGNAAEQNLPPGRPPDHCEHVGRNCRRSRNLSGRLGLRLACPVGFGDSGSSWCRAREQPQNIHLALAKLLFQALQLDGELPISSFFPRTPTTAVHARAHSAAFRFERRSHLELLPHRVSLTDLGLALPHSGMPVLMIKRSSLSAKPIKLGPAIGAPGSKARFAGRAFASRWPARWHGRYPGRIARRARRGVRQPPVAATRPADLQPDLAAAHRLGQSAWISRQEIVPGRSPSSSMGSPGGRFELSLQVQQGGPYACSAN